MHRIALLTVLLAALVIPVAGARTTDGTLSLVAYSTPKAAFSTIIPAFQKTPAGQGVNFTQSYGASADQTQAIVNGLPADVVDLSLEPDMKTLVKAGLVAPNWNANKHKGIVTRSVVVIVVRSGKKIRGWNDLIKPGVAGADAESPHLGRRALERPRRIRRAAQAREDTEAGGAVPLQALPPRRRPGQVGARRAEHVPRGKGDALLTYENEALLAQRYRPARLLQHPEGDDPDRQPARRDDQQQEHHGGKGVRQLPLHADRAAPLRAERLPPRSVERDEGLQLPRASELFTADYLGGWTKAQKKFFDPNTGLMAKIEASLGG